MKGQCAVHWRACQFQLELHGSAGLADALWSLAWWTRSIIRPEMRPGASGDFGWPEPAGAKDHGHLRTLAHRLAMTPVFCQKRAFPGDRVWPDEKCEPLPADTWRLDAPGGMVT